MKVEFDITVSLPVEVHVVAEVDELPVDREVGSEGGWELDSYVAIHNHSDRTDDVDGEDVCKIVDMAVELAASQHQTRRDARADAMNDLLRDVG